MERVHALTEARLAKKLTLEKVAEFVGVDTSTVARWERGERTPRSAHKLALERLFGKPAHELGLEPSSHTVGESHQADYYEEDEDASSLFRNQHFFLRLQRIVWGWSHSASYHELQAMILLEEENMTFHEMNRREALRLLASMPIEYGLIANISTFKRPNEAILAQCAAGITACRKLSRGHDIAFAFSTIKKYIPVLEDIARGSEAQKRKQAADLLVQCYLLISNLAPHLESSIGALRYIKQAESFLDLAENPMLAIRVARTKANAHDYTGRKQQALRVGLQAKYLLETEKGISVPSSLASNVYASLADYQAQNGQKQDALASLQKAHNIFFASDEPDTILAQERGNLLIHDGLVHYYLGLYKQAATPFEQIGTLQECRTTSQIEALINRVWSEVMQPERDQEKCIAFWKEGIQGAINIQSEAQYQDAQAAYTAMRVAWPGEVRIKELQDYAIHW